MALRQEIKIDGTRTQNTGTRPIAQEFSLRLVDDDTVQIVSSQQTIQLPIAELITAIGVMLGTKSVLDVPNMSPAQQVTLLEQLWKQREKP